MYIQIVRAVWCCDWRLVAHIGNYGGKLCRAPVHLPAGHRRSGTYLPGFTLATAYQCRFDSSLLLADDATSAQPKQGSLTSLEAICPYGLPR